MVAESTVDFNDNAAKFYLDADNIHVGGKKLYVNLEGVVHEVSNLHVDSKGIYIQLNDFVDQGAIVDCPVGHPNPPWNLVCWVCGRNLY